MVRWIKIETSTCDTWTEFKDIKARLYKEAERNNIEIEVSYKHKFTIGIGPFIEYYIYIKEPKQ